MKQLLAGLFTLAMLIIIALITRNENILIYGTGALGFGSFFLGGILSGFLSDSYHRTTAFESANECQQRIRTTGKFILFSIPHLVALFGYYLFIK